MCTQECVNTRKKKHIQNGDMSVQNKVRHVENMSLFEEFVALPVVFFEFRYFSALIAPHVAHLATFVMSINVLCCAVLCCASSCAPDNNPSLSRKQYVFGRG